MGHRSWVIGHRSSVIGHQTPADWLRQDVRYAVRGLLRSPVFAITVILTFALGVGANAAIFSLIDPLLLRNPAGVVEPERVRRVYYADGTGIPVPFFSGASYTALRAALAGRARVAPKLGADSVSMALGAALGLPVAPAIEPLGRVLHRVRVGVDDVLRYVYPVAECVAVVVDRVLTRVLDRRMPCVAGELAVRRIAEEHGTGVGVGDEQDHIRRRWHL